MLNDLATVYFIPSYTAHVQSETTHIFKALHWQIPFVYIILSPSQLIIHNILHLTFMGPCSVIIF